MTKSENSSMIILSTERRGISPHAFPANDCDKESRLEEQTAAGRTAYAPETGDICRQMPMQSSQSGSKMIRETKAFP